jgi:hypothetical protein
LFSSVGTDPGTPPVYTLDFGMNFRLSQHTILDVGVNLGLNSAAPKAQIYTGISARFWSARMRVAFPANCETKISVPRRYLS